MKAYYDTGVLLKLYLEEPQSDQVREFVTSRGEAIYITELHLAEFSSALQLKQYRGECEVEQVASVLSHLASDRRTGVLSLIAMDWAKAWNQCIELANAHAASTGCRTLDTLHVACARTLEMTHFITSDERQIRMAAKAKLKVTNPIFP